MDGFFSFLGKAALILIVAGVLIGGGYYLGTGNLPFPMNPAPGALSTTAIPPTPTTTDEHMLTPAATPSGQAIAPSVTGGPTQTISGGGPRGTSFSPFTIQVPPSWTVQKNEVPNVSYKLTISQGNYSMSIYQAPTGGGGCTYPGDPPQEMSSSFGPYTSIHDAQGNDFRRATPAGNASGFTVCQKGPTFYGLPTMYGHVTYGTPINPNPAILSQMDALFATLKN